MLIEAIYADRITRLAMTIGEAKYCSAEDTREQENIMTETTLKFFNQAIFYLPGCMTPGCIAGHAVVQELMEDGNLTDDELQKRFDDASVFAAPYLGLGHGWVSLFKMYPLLQGDIVPPKMAKEALLFARDAYETGYDPWYIIAEMQMEDK